MKVRSGLFVTSNTCSTNILSRRKLAVLAALALGVTFLWAEACSTIPENHVRKYKFPGAQAFFDVPKDRPFSKLGLVRSKVNYKTLDPNREENDLCKNYFNKAVIDLVKRAREKGADAVVDVKSVTFLVDGRNELYPRAECADDGEGGQVLAQGVAIKWDPVPSPSPNR